jgi:tetrahydromethanopterin S-methyltransferase subunit G
MTISNINKAITLERWNEISHGKVIPMKELLSEGTYSQALSKIEKLYEDELLFSVNGLPDHRRNELGNLDIETYTESAYRELWGYDDNTVSLLYNLDKIFDKLYSESTDKYNEMNLEVAIRYIEAFRGRTVSITDGDKSLLKLMNKRPASFGYAHDALFNIYEISPAGDKILQAKTEYERINAEITNEKYKYKDKEESEASKRSNKEMRRTIGFLLGLVVLCLIYLANNGLINPIVTLIAMLLLSIYSLFNQL